MSLYDDLQADATGLLATYGTAVVLSRAGADYLKAIGVFGDLTRLLGRDPLITASTLSLVISGAAKSAPMIGDLVRRKKDAEAFYVVKVAAAKPADTVITWTLWVNQ